MKRINGMPDAQRKAMFANMNHNPFQFGGFGMQGLGRIAQGFATPGGMLNPQQVMDPWGTAYGIGSRTIRKLGPRNLARYGTALGKDLGELGYTLGRESMQLPVGLTMGVGDVASAGRYPLTMLSTYPAIMSRGLGAGIGAFPRGIIEGITTGQVGQYQYEPQWPGPYPYQLPPRQQPSGQPPIDEKDAVEAAGLMDWIRAHPTEAALGIGLGTLGLGVMMSD